MNTAVTLGMRGVPVTSVTAVASVIGSTQTPTAGTLGMCVIAALSNQQVNPM